MRRKDCTGKKFGKLTIHSIDWNKSRAFCKCDCGKSKSINLHSVTSGHTKSCGCGMYQYQKGPLSYKCKGYGEILGRKWSGIKSNAKNRHIPFTVSIKDAWNQFLKQNRQCAYSGKELYFRRSSYDYDYDTASLDRINSSKGYVEGNVQWIHKTINEIKWDLSSERFLELCRLIVNPLNHNSISNSCIITKKYTFKGIGNLGLKQWNRILKNSKNRRIKIDITINDAWKLFLKQKGYCALTGLPIYFNNSTDITASLDRIDNTKGYVKENVQWIHKDINYKLKRHFSEIELKTICRSIVKNLRSDA